MTILTQPQTTVYEGLAAERRLLELGLSRVGLEEVVRRGESARAEATAHDPVNAAGWDAYRYRVRGLRDVYASGGTVGWEPKTQEGLELLWRSDGRVAVVTRSGNEGVGVARSMPQPSRSVGDSTRHAASAQLSLDPNWLNRKTAPKEGVRLYMLLVYSAVHVVRSELSLPSSLDDDGLVSGWVERILLPDLDLLEPTLTFEEPPMSPIEVPVARKR